MYEPAIGDTVTLLVNGEPAAGEVQEINQSMGVVGVRITEEGNEFQGQKVYANAAQLTPVVFRRIQ
jgi:hypothetical protein